MTEHAVSFGLACWHGGVDRMAVAHTHDDLELNASDVDLEYLVDGRRVVIPAGSLAVFWAARPHQLVTATDAHEITWLTVPLSQALGWRLPSGFVARMFAGEVAFADAAGPLSLVDRVDHWSRELASASALRDVAALEIRAFLLRAAAAVAAAPGRPSDDSGLRPEVARMAAWIADHASDDISVADVAAEGHLHPHYAMAVFRAAMGVTIGDYLAQCRIARAQHLLLTTGMPIAAIAHEAGFGSLSQFYARFRERWGEPPAAYRRRLAPTA
jgi:AraC-like DNA-binding protein